MANSGLGDAARPLAERFLRIFGDYDHVVCPSGSCASMVRVHYRGLLADPASQELTGRLARVTRATRELCEFLVDVVKVEQASGRFPRRHRTSREVHGRRPTMGRPCGSRAGGPRQAGKFRQNRDCIHVESAAWCGAASRCDR